MLKTNIKKHTLNKLLKDCCTKNAFTFNNLIYEQIDGVSMGSCLGPTLASIIMTELEIKVANSFFKDDTLLLIKGIDHFTVIVKIKFLITKGTTLFTMCPCCNGCFIDETERCLITRITKHGTKEIEPMFKHLSGCEVFKDCYCLYSLLLLFSEDEHDSLSL